MWKFIQNMTTELSSSNLQTAVTASYAHTTTLQVIFSVLSLIPSKLSPFFPLSFSIQVFLLLFSLSFYLHVIFSSLFIYLYRSGSTLNQPDKFVQYYGRNVSSLTNSTERGTKRNYTKNKQIFR